MSNNYSAVNQVNIICDEIKNDNISLISKYLNENVSTETIIGFVIDKTIKSKIRILL